MRTLFTTVAFFSLSVLVQAQLKPTPLTGTWRVVEVSRSGPNGGTLHDVPGLLLLTGTHYSRIYIATEQPRKALTDTAKASAEELLATWGPVVVASGTYEIVGDKVNFHAIVAKNPQVMAAGRIAVYTFKLEGTKLTMTGVRSDPTTITYTRVE
jgi:hypothetical protein